MTSETVINAFTARIAPIQFRRHEQARVSTDTSFRKTSWNAPIQRTSLSPAERAANLALRDSRADLASHLARAGVRYPIPAPKARKVQAKKIPAVL